MKQRGGGDFKSPASTPDSPGSAKKKRRTSSVTSASSTRTATPPAVQTSPMPELIPPPPISGYGDTIVASNPFDDTPPPRSMPQQVQHMGMPPRGPPPPGMHGHMNHQLMNQQMMHSGGPPNGPPPHMQQHGQPGHFNPRDPGGMMGPGPGMPGNMGMGMPPQQMQQHMNMNMNAPPRPHMMNPGQMPPHNNGPNNPGGPMMSPQGMPPGMGGGPGSGSPMPMPMSGHSNGHSGMNPNWNGPPPKPMPIQSGKIYPPDMAMVFNPQNPNAPPIYPCGVCHKEVHDNDQAIPCESGCNFWFHRVCTGLSEAGFHFLNQEVYAEWVCDKCLGSKNIPLVKYKP